MDYVPVPVVPEILRAKVSVFVDLHRKTRQLERLNASSSSGSPSARPSSRTPSRRKDEFLAVLAHELRNPLAAIRLAAQLVVPAGPAAGAARQVGGRHPAAGRAPRPAHRRSRGRVAHHARADQPAPRADRDLGASSRRRSSRAGRSIDTTHHIAHGRRPRRRSLQVEGDAARLAQVLANILNNAAKFTDPGGRIQLDVARDGDEVVIDVTDTGVGISRRDAAAGLRAVHAGRTPARSRRRAGSASASRSCAGWSRCTAAGSTRESDGPGTGAEIVVHLPLLDRRRRPSSARSPATRAPSPGSRRAGFWSSTTTRTPPRRSALMLQLRDTRCRPRTTGRGAGRRARLPAARRAARPRHAEPERLRNGATGSEPSRGAKTSR